MLLPSQFSASYGAQKANALLDFTCSTDDSGSSFSSTTDSDNFVDVENPSMAQNSQKNRPGKGINTNRIPPTLPTPHFYSTLQEPNKYQDYITAHLQGPIHPPEEGAPLRTTGTSAKSAKSTQFKSWEPFSKSANVTSPIAALSDSCSFEHEHSNFSGWIGESLFPDHHLPVPFKDNLLDTAPVFWDRNSQTFVDFPKKFTEAMVADWLNDIADSLGLIHGLIVQEPTKAGSNADTTSVHAQHGQESPADLFYLQEKLPDRRFSSTGHKAPPTGGFLKRNPDISLLQRSLSTHLEKKKERLRWQHVQAFVEVTGEKSKPTILDRMKAKSSIMFECQPWRRFVISLGIWCRKFCVMIADRSGITYTSWTNIESYNAVDFCRIMFGLAYADPYFLGVDSSMVINDCSGDLTHITIQKQNFTVVKLIYSSMMTVGRGTHIFIVKDDQEKLYVVKDSWILVHHGFSEIDMLSTIGKTIEAETLVDDRLRRLWPKFIMSEEFQDDVTGTRRGRLRPTPLNRIHRRIVTGAIGDPLTSFRSREEFVLVLIDCVKFLQFLHNTCKIVHGDISLNNIVICREPITTDTPPQSYFVQPTTPNADAASNITTHGLIIDYDYARKRSTPSQMTSGTLPYMAIEGLNIKKLSNYVHEPTHDLESLFYTVLTIMSFTQGPCNPGRDLDEVWFARWFNQIDCLQLQSDKSVDMLLLNKVTEEVHDYWRPFVPFAERLHAATFEKLQLPLKSVIDHDVYLAILYEAHAAMKALKEIPAPYPRIPPSKSGKRPRDEDYVFYPNAQFVRSSEYLKSHQPRPAKLMRLMEQKEPKE